MYLRFVRSKSVVAAYSMVIGRDCNVPEPKAFVAFLHQGEDAGELVDGLGILGHVSLLLIHAGGQFRESSRARSDAHRVGHYYGRYSHRVRGLDHHVRPLLDHYSPIIMALRMSANGLPISCLLYVESVIPLVDFSTHQRDYDRPTEVLPITLQFSGLNIKTSYTPPPGYSMRSSRGYSCIQRGRLRHRYQLRGLFR